MERVCQRVQAPIQRRQAHWHYCRAEACVLKHFVVPAGDRPQPAEVGGILLPVRHAKTFRRKKTHDRTKAVDINDPHERLGDTGRKLREWFVLGHNPVRMDDGLVHVSADLS